MKCEHKNTRTRTTCFLCCVSPEDCNEAAHGNIQEIEICDCGAERTTNINGCHVETSEWRFTDDF